MTEEEKKKHLESAKSASSEAIAKKILAALNKEKKK